MPTRRRDGHTGSADQPVDPAALGEIAITVAREAGQLIRTRLRSRSAHRLQVSSKATPTDLVTDVDRAVETQLLDRLRQLRPQDAVLGEERGASVGSSGVRWLLDPIDGTVNFVLGLPAFAVSVAAEQGGRLLAGAVYAPVSGELFHASAGGGAYLGRRRLPGPRSVPLASAVIGTGFGYDRRQRVAQAKVVVGLIDSIADIRRIGAASLDLCYVAAGRLDGYFEAGLKPWDWGAGLLIATESGAVASGLHGREPGEQMTVVAGKTVAGPLVAALERLGADQLLRS